MIVLKEMFESGSGEGQFIGYRCMRYDPESGKAISGADSRHSVELEKFGVMKYGKGHFLTDSAQYAKDYYAVHDHNVLIKVEFNASDVLSGHLDDTEPEISVRQSKILDWEIFDELEEKRMTKFDAEYKRIMEFLSADALGGSEGSAGGYDSDWYAPGDARVPKVIGQKTVKKKKKKKKAKDGDYVQPDNVVIPVSRRTFPNM